MSEPYPIRFIGGPHDGLTKPWYDNPPPPSIRLPIARTLPPLGVVRNLEPEINPRDDALYYLARDERGYPSRADDGALRYEFHS